MSRGLGSPVLGQSTAQLLLFGRTNSYYNLLCIWQGYKFSANINDSQASNNQTKAEPNFKVSDIQRVHYRWFHCIYFSSALYTDHGDVVLWMHQLAVGSHGGDLDHGSEGGIREGGGRRRGCSHRWRRRGSRGSVLVCRECGSGDIGLGQWGRLGTGRWLHGLRDKHITRQHTLKIIMYKEGIFKGEESLTKFL